MTLIELIFEYAALVSCHGRDRANNWLRSVTSETIAAEVISTVNDDGKFLRVSPKVAGTIEPISGLTLCTLYMLDGPQYNVSPDKSRRNLSQGKE